MIPILFISLLYCKPCISDCYDDGYLAYDYDSIFGYMPSFHSYTEFDRYFEDNYPKRDYLYYNRYPLYLRYLNYSNRRLYKRSLEGTGDLIDLSHVNDEPNNVDKELRSLEGAGSNEGSGNGFLDLSHVNDEPNNVDKEVRSDIEGSVSDEGSGSVEGSNNGFLDLSHIDKEPNNFDKEVRSDIEGSGNDFLDLSHVNDEPSNVDKEVHVVYINNDAPLNDSKELFDSLEMFRKRLILLNNEVTTTTHVNNPFPEEFLQVDENATYPLSSEMPREFVTDKKWLTNNNPDLKDLSTTSSTEIPSDEFEVSFEKNFVVIDSEEFFKMWADFISFNPILDSLWDHRLNKRQVNSGLKFEYELGDITKKVIFPTINKILSDGNHLLNSAKLPKITVEMKKRSVQENDFQVFVRELLEFFKEKVLPRLIHALKELDIIKININADLKNAPAEVREALVGINKRSISCYDPVSDLLNWMEEKGCKRAKRELRTRKENAFMSDIARYFANLNKNNNNGTLPNNNGTLKVKNIKKREIDDIAKNIDNFKNLPYLPIQNLSGPAQNFISSQNEQLSGQSDMSTLQQVNNYMGIVSGCVIFVCGVCYLVSKVMKKRREVN